MNDDLKKKSNDSMKQHIIKVRKDLDKEAKVAKDTHHPTESKELKHLKNIARGQRIENKSKLEKGKVVHGKPEKNTELEPSASKIVQPNTDESVKKIETETKAIEDKQKTLISKLNTMNNDVKHLSESEFMML